MTADPPPHTGHAVIDEACVRVADLSQTPIADHPRLLAEAHEAIASALQNAPLVALPDR